MLFAAASSMLAINEGRRGRICRVNAELMETRELLARGQPLGERLRISRDLHDSSDIT